MRFYEIAACARQARSSSPGGTSESRNKPLRTPGTGTESSFGTAGYGGGGGGGGGYDLRGFARHVGERTASLVVSRTQSRQTYLNAHTSARVCDDLARVYARVHVHTHTGARGNGRLRGA